MGSVVIDGNDVYEPVAWGIWSCCNSNKIQAKNELTFKAAVL